MCLKIIGTFGRTVKEKKMKKTRIVVLLSFIVFNLLWVPPESFGLDVGDKAPLFSGNSTVGDGLLTLSTKAASFGLFKKGFQKIRTS
jgi:hypothetical protein